MRGLIIFAVLLCAAAGKRASNYAVQQDLLTRLREEINKDNYSTTINSIPETTATSPATPIASNFTSSANEESSTLKPSTEAISPPQETTLVENISEISVSLPPTAVDEVEPPSKRRVVTYDQRQEGQYNIRADLENFMIVLIPPNPVEGLNLLDLSTKSSQRRNQPHLSKSKRKHATAVQFSKPHRQDFSYIARSQPLSNSVVSSTVKQMPVAIIDGSSAAGSGSSSQRLPEFIEGRTPYHVDISANDDEQSRLHPDLQVDVLPPPYPLAYQHLIKPFHLEAEPTVIQALPPPELQAAHVSGNFLESYNQLLNSAAESSSRARHNNNGPELGYYRISRAIRSDNSIDSNNLGSTQTTPHRFTFFREHTLGRYPPIDIPEGFFALKSQRRSTDQNADTVDQILDDDSSVPHVIVPPLNNFPQDDIEQDLHDVRLLDLEARTLLSDGLERCAPGHRRDSYGMCREIEGY